MAIFRPHWKCNRRSKPHGRGLFSGLVFWDHDFEFFWFAEGSRGHLLFGRECGLDVVNDNPERRRVVILRVRKHL